MRNVLKVVLAPSGSVCARDSRDPIDLDSFWFVPIFGTLRAEFPLATRGGR